MKNDELLRLLVIESSLEDAEHQLSTLRNAGIAVRPSSAEDEDELQAVLERQPLDLILLNPVHQELTIPLVAAAVTRIGKDLPIIAILDDFDVEQLGKAIRDGAMDAVSAESPEHLEAVVRRELTNLNSRRRARVLEASLRETEKRCHALLDSSRDAIAYVHEGMHVYANPAYLHLFDYDEFEEMEGLPILDMVTSEHAGKLKEIFKQISTGQTPPDEIEVDVAVADGGSREVMMEFSAASIDGEPCTQVVLRDKTVDASVAQELKDLRTQDLVTGLYNRQHIVKVLEQAIADTLSENAIYSVLVVQIDNFKSVLDRVGLAGVDLVLSDVATVVREQLGESQSAGRLDDHSFVIVMPDVDADSARVFAEKLRSAVEGHISEIGGSSLTVTVSIGLTRITEALSKPNDLLTLVGAAAREAAAEGGNRIVLKTPGKNEDEVEDEGVQWVHRTEKALENDDFHLVYQPVISLHGDESNIYEVLLRMVGDDGEDIAAGQFLPHVTGHEIMSKIDRWVVLNAIKAIAAHQADDQPPVTFFVKLSTQTLVRPETLPWLAKALQQHRVSGDRLVFEAPESKLMTNLKPARQFVKGLKQLHCRFAIEQFGSGLNSFQILKHLPADFLKIDRSFMQDLPKSDEHQQRIKEITDQAHSMGKATIAEFVEDATSMSILWQSGVNFVQGNFLQEPEKVLAYDFA